ncbi:helix-turn-helix transcriptional regulator [Planosporangium mesophilum]|nr:winged helix-turn-helix domain-containing protein [Planosporangium mesophilum]NJC82079.1 helix-turn-helix transcriptional regulator [Planosporangium mesophilum]
MRALAHPARLAIMDALATGQTGTATQFAQIVGLSPSATSYHLRALAKYELVEEAPSRGDGRERVWKRTGRRIQLDAGPNDPPEVLDAGRLLTDALLARDEAQARQWWEVAASEDPEWYAASRLSKTHIVVTADELQQLNEAIEELIKPYSLMRRLSTPEGARPVAVSYWAFPIDRLASGDVKP